MNQSKSTWTINGKTYSDRELVAAILAGNSVVINTFFYQDCYPMFAAAYNKYYTDCESPLELINEIFLFILYEKEDCRTPDHRNSKLARFEYRCTLTAWIKIVLENYCYQLFSKKMQIDENLSNPGDRNTPEEESFESNFNNLDMADLKTILNLMPNERYRRLIELRYIEERTNEETAELLSMNMANYYNKHKLAKEQFCNVLRKEGLV